MPTPKFLKIQRKHSLGRTTDMVVTGEYESKEAAEKDLQTTGTIYPVIAGRTLLKNFREKK